MDNCDRFIQHNNNIAGVRRKGLKGKGARRRKEERKGSSYREPLGSIREIFSPQYTCR